MLAVGWLLFGSLGFSGILWGTLGCWGMLRDGFKQFYCPLTELG